MRPTCTLFSSLCECTACSTTAFLSDLYLLCIHCSTVQLWLPGLISSILLRRDGFPGTQSVTEEFALEWPQVLSGMQNVALAWVDGRSGVGRGQKTSTVDPRRLASMRVKDYLGVVESVGNDARERSGESKGRLILMVFPQVIDAAALHRRPPNSPLRQGYSFVQTQISSVKPVIAVT